MDQLSGVKRELVKLFRTDIPKLTGEKDQLLNERPAQQRSEPPGPVVISLDLSFCGVDPHLRSQELRLDHNPGPEVQDQGPGTSQAPDRSHFCRCCSWP